ncbi:MAG: bifunctional aldolase/short-chain dehydrogenase [Gammaproteobacteria bacterium]|nr:bifunctional aldolase/short-chain dehydrogenase [Gammaproteobacteria bacterium]
MENRWNDADAQLCKDDLDLRVYSSRLLGQDPSLVLHGGGNTSVKVTQANIFGEDEEILLVKGSGWDLATIERAGFAPVKLNHLIRLAELDQLSDPEMVRQLKSNMTNPSAPTPSVEAILHAVLPYKFVDHTHADALVTVTNNPHGKENIQAIYGDDVVIIDYIMPGFDLARQCAQQFKAQATDRTIGMVLMNHGMFSFANTAKASYERMIDLVERAETFIKQNNAWDLPEAVTEVSLDSLRLPITKLRHNLSQHAGRAMILHLDNNSNSHAFVRRPDLHVVSQQGPATPDHVIRTKPLPCLGRDLNAYAANYEDYFEKRSQKSKAAKTILDKAPRVILDEALGLLCAGKSASDAFIVNDIYQHTIEVILRAERLGGYRALPAQDIFDMEYWDLEQAKLKQSGQSPAFQGEVVCITGAASGIGKACVEAFMRQGAAVIGIDVNPGIESLYEQANYYGVICDVSDEQQVINALELGVRQFGGLDMLVLNAGMFPGGAKIADIDLIQWRKVMQVNLDANLVFMREAAPLLSLAPNGGRVVMMGSKNVPAPGPGAAAYSASKAALTQLARVAALEWGSDNIRINTLHPDAVFDTGIWTDEVLQARADHYGMNVQAYKTKNLLRREITSAQVADLAVATCSSAFYATTGAQIPIDGGNDRVI